MDDALKKRGIAQLNDMLSHWEEKDGEFRSYVSWRSDMFKMVGAGNTSGILAIAVFLTTGTRTGGLIAAAKICLLIYAAGFALFFSAYRRLYKCTGHMEDCLISMRRGLDGPNTSVAEAFELSQSTGMPIFISVICFVVASAMAVLGLLLT